MLPKRSNSHKFGGKSHDPHKIFLHYHEKPTVNKIETEIETEIETKIETVEIIPRHCEDVVMEYIYADNFPIVEAHDNELYKPKSPTDKEREMYMKVLNKWKEYKK